MHAKEERIAFEHMMERELRKYFGERVQKLVTGQILIEDDGSVIRIYEKKDKGTGRYDMGIIY